MQVPSQGQEDPLEGRAWQLTPVFLPRESHGQRSLAGYSLWGHKELDTTECLNTHTRNSQSTWTAALSENRTAMLKYLCLQTG